MDFIYQANLYFLTFKFHHLSLLLCIIFPFQKNLLIIIIFVQIICSFLHQNHCYVLQKLFNSIALIIVLILLIIILPVILLTLVILIVPPFYIIFYLIWWSINYPFSKIIYQPLSKNVLCLNSLCTCSN